MRRRDFIIGIGSSAAAWPLMARAQQPPVLGFLSGRSAAEAASAVIAFREGLADTGYIEGNNVTLEYRWAEGRYDRLPAMASELVDRQVAVMLLLAGRNWPPKMRLPEFRSRSPLAVIQLSLGW